MLLILLLIIPLIGIFIISTVSYGPQAESDLSLSLNQTRNVKIIALSASTINLFVSLIVYILFNFSSNQFQFVQEYHKISSFDFYLGVDGISIYFVLLTTIIMPIALLSNWSSISENVKSYVIIILLLETLLLAVFLVLNILLFYIFFESIIFTLFILIGLFGSSNRVRASFYLFLYTLLASFFLFFYILIISLLMGSIDFYFSYYIHLCIIYPVLFKFKRNVILHFYTKFEVYILLTISIITIIIGMFILLSLLSLLAFITIDDLSFISDFFANNIENIVHQMNGEAQRPLSLSPTQVRTFFGNFTSAYMHLYPNLQEGGVLSFRDICSQQVFFSTTPTPYDIIESIARSKNLTEFNLDFSAIGKSNNQLLVMKYLSELQK